MKRKLNKGLAFIAATAMMALLFAPVAQAVPGHGIPVNPEDRCLECMVDGNPRKVWVDGAPMECGEGTWRTHPPVHHHMPVSEFEAFDFGGGWHLILEGGRWWVPGWDPANQYTNGLVQGFSDWFHYDDTNSYAGTWWVTWPAQFRDAPVGTLVWGDTLPALGVNQWWIYSHGCTVPDCLHVSQVGCNGLFQRWEVQTRLPDWGPYQEWIHFITHGGWITYPGHFEYYCACEVPGVPCDDCGEYPCECVDPPPPPPVCDDCGEYPCVCEDWCYLWTDEQYAVFDALLDELNALKADIDGLLEIILGLCPYCWEYDYVEWYPGFLELLDWLNSGDARGYPNNWCHMVWLLEDLIAELADEYDYWADKIEAFECVCEKCCDDYPDCDCDEEEPAPPRAPQTGDVASAAPFVFGALMSLSALAGGITLKKRNK